MTLGRKDGPSDAILRSRLAFLFGDLCLSTKIVAAIFRASESEVAETIGRLSVKWCHGVHGRLSRKSFVELSKLMVFDPSEVGTIEARHEWQTMKTVLGREFLRLAIDDTIPWSEMDAFLVGLPAIHAEGKKRVTVPRLQFLYGDLGATMSDIMLILDVTEWDVRLMLREIERHGAYHSKLNERVLDELAKRLGLDSWPKDRFARSKATYYWPIVKREVRKGLIRLAEKGQLDLAIVDDFLVNLPAIAAQVREARQAWLEQVAPNGGKRTLATPFRAASRDAHAKSPTIPAEIAAEVMTEFLSQHYSTWPDCPLPALEGTTPREATKTEAGRAAVESLIQDIELRSHGTPMENAYDFDNLRHDLGLPSA